MTTDLYQVYTSQWFHRENKSIGSTTLQSALADLAECEAEPTKKEWTARLDCYFNVLLHPRLYHLAGQTKTRWLFPLLILLFFFSFFNSRENKWGIGGVVWPYNMKRKETWLQRTRVGFWQRASLENVTPTSSHNAPSFICECRFLFVSFCFFFQSLLSFVGLQN